MPVTDTTAADIAALADAGYGEHTIAASLNRRDVPTRSGRGVWHPGAVYEVLHPGWRASYQRAYRAGWGR